MESEIGSIFPISGYEYKTGEQRNSFEKFHFFSLCREALLAAAKGCEKKRKVILLPAYTCQTVIDPFVQEEWEIQFYSITKKLRISRESFLSLMDRYEPGMVFFHPYYGKALTDSEGDLLKKAKESGALVVQDLTQSVFSDFSKPYADITVGSFRKWTSIPDGAFLKTNGNVSLAIEASKEYNTRFITSQLDAMYLRGEYFRTGNIHYKEISIRLNKYAEGLAEKEAVICHKISDYSMAALMTEDFERIKKKRIDNFTTLFSLINNNEKCYSVIDDIKELDSAPLYYPVYVEDRALFQKKLAQKGIYAPILWGVENKNVLIDDQVEYIYKHLLAIPIDQRYDYDDMQRIAAIINMISSLEEGS